jgi:hypothetical protein
VSTQHVVSYTDRVDPENIVVPRAVASYTFPDGQVAIEEPMPLMSPHVLVQHWVAKEEDVVTAVAAFELSYALLVPQLDVPIFQTATHFGTHVAGAGVGLVTAAV